MFDTGMCFSASLNGCLQAKVNVTLLLGGVSLHYSSFAPRLFPLRSLIACSVYREGRPVNLVTCGYVW